MKFIACSVLLCSAFSCAAQFSHPQDLGARLLRTDTSGTYFASGLDPGYVVHYNSDSSYYRRISPEGIVVEEGGLAGHGMLWYGRNGEWTQYDLSGRKERTLHFCEGHEVGAYLEYFDDGTVSRRYHVTWVDGICVQLYASSTSFLSGPYQEYYENGQLEEEGNFKLVRDSFATIEKTEISSRGMMRSAERVGIKSVRCGTWRYFNKDGTLKRKEEHG